LGHEDSGPEEVLQLVLLDRIGALLEEDFEQPERLRRQRDGLAAPEELSRSAIQHKGAEANAHLSRPATSESKPKAIRRTSVFRGASLTQRIPEEDLDERSPGLGAERQDRTEGRARTGGRGFRARRHRVRAGSP